MFASIKTNGATHIAIHIPHAGAERSLPALAAMLENNAVFISSGYSDLSMVKPTMSIILGDKFICENSDAAMEVHPSGAVLGEDFLIYSTEVHLSNAKALKKEKEENSRLRTELSFVKSQLQTATDQVKALTALETE